MLPSVQIDTRLSISTTPPTSTIDRRPSTIDHRLRPSTIDHRLSTLALATLLLSGCGGGVPLLYPARALPKGDVRGAAGLSAEAPVGSLASNLNAARNDAAANSGLPPPQGDTTYAKGALVAAAVAPGLAPFVAARVGVGGGIEGGIAYTGRA
ncbi:MAG: hypothetical protein ACRELY_13385, partial [Polyangiaceae bacterium]